MRGCTVFRAEDCGWPPARAILHTDGGLRARGVIRPREQRASGAKTKAVSVVPGEVHARVVHHTRDHRDVCTWSIALSTRGVGRTSGSFEEQVHALAPRVLCRECALHATPPPPNSRGPIGVDWKAVHHSRVGGGRAVDSVGSLQLTYLTGELTYLALVSTRYGLMATFGRKLVRVSKPSLALTKCQSSACSGSWPFRQDLKVRASHEKSPCSNLHAC